MCAAADEHSFSLPFCHGIKMTELRTFSLLTSSLPLFWGERLTNTSVHYNHDGMIPALGLSAGFAHTFMPSGALCFDSAYRNPDR